jgi:cell fate (sporulation/competence/biofilm development) regulator YmcA (YheA/YmcA/DUF963 family)
LLSFVLANYHRRLYLSIKSSLLTSPLLNAKIAKNNAMDISQEQYDQIAKKEDFLPIIEDLKEIKLIFREIIAKAESLRDIVQDMHTGLTGREIKK